MRIKIAKSQINYVTFDSAYNLIRDNIGLNGYICLTDAYVLATACKDQFLNNILNNSYATFPDGKLLQIIAKINGYYNIDTISGYFLMEKFLKSSKVKHYFYGSTEHTISELESQINRKYPLASVLGFKSAPMIELSKIKSSQILSQDLTEIARLSPDILWIGISSPKQDYLMYHYKEFFNNTLLIGIGAVFDYHSGIVKKSPEWVKKIGLRWLYRFFKEPFRIYKKTYTLFIFSSKIIIETIFRKYFT